MSAYTDHIRACLRKDAKLRAQHPEYPIDDKMDHRLLRGEISEQEHRLYLVHQREQLEAWFAELPKKIEKAFAPYLGVKT